MNNKKLIIGGSLLALGAIIAFNSCRSIPKGATAVQPFEKEKYLSKWYEIARFDFMYEKNMNNTTADYTLNNDGTIKVVNRGYNYKKNKYKEATGKAKFVKTPDIGMLKVSFFGPFYSGYNVIAIDKDYKYALVAGKNLDYLWLLSREKTMPQGVIDSYLKKAQEIGYDTSKLVWTEQK